MRIKALVFTTALAIVSASTGSSASEGTFRGSDYLTNVVELRYGLGSTPGSVRATVAGYYREGAHDPSATSYVAGQGGSTSIADFFVFDLSDVSGPITSGSLVLEQPLDGYLGPATGLRFSLHDVSTPISTLLAPHEDEFEIFSDLVSGSEYGSILVKPDSVATLLRVDFNSAGLAALNASEGRRFAVGGDAFVSLVPLPASAPMFGAALLAFATVGYGLKRRRAAAA